MYSIAKKSIYLLLIHDQKVSSVKDFPWNNENGNNVKKSKWK